MGKDKEMRTGLQMRDGATKYPTVEQMRALWEATCRDTPVLAKRTNLVAVLAADQFCGYADATTDTLWVGFAIGLRCAQRMLEAQYGTTGGLWNRPRLKVRRQKPEGPA